MKKIVVLLSSYNGEKYIAQQIESVLNQKINLSLSLLIRDDGSTDSTVNLINDYCQRFSNIRLIKGENVGLVASFFQLIEEAFHSAETYDYFSLADQDDVWDLDKLAIAVNKIDNNENQNIPMLYCSSSRPVNDTLQPIPKKTYKRKPLRYYNTMIQNSTPGHTYVFNRNLAELVCSPDPSKVYVHDSYILNVAVICGDVIYDPTMHTSYRQHSSNQLGTSNSGTFSWIKSRLKRLKRGDGKKYADQIEYLYDAFGDSIPLDQQKETNRFLKNRRNFVTRVVYALSTKFYRQRPWQSIAFRLLYVFGGYNNK